MDMKKYQRTTEEQVKGRRFRLNREIQSRVAVIPRGTVVTIDGKFKGFSVLTEKCGCCGMQARVNRVEPRFLDELPASEGGTLK